jgi:hypothetical protein
MRPFPKAEPQEVSNKGKKRRKAAILTDTPGKRATEEEKKPREEKKNKKATGQKRMDLEINKNNKARVMKRKLLHTEISSKKDDDEVYWCLVCGIQYKAGEDWVQCLKCELWSHFACSGHNTQYVCTDCDDDSD